MKFLLMFKWGNENIQYDGKLQNLKMLTYFVLKGTSTLTPLLSHDTYRPHNAFCQERLTSPVVIIKHNGLLGKGSGESSSFCHKHIG